MCAQLVGEASTPLQLAVVYGPEQLELRDHYGIQLYPTLLLFVNGDLKAEYPRYAPVIVTR
jgi:hypothetical protein